MHYSAHHIGDEVDPSENYRMLDIVRTRKQDVFNNETCTVPCPHKYAFALMSDEGHPSKVRAKLLPLVLHMLE